MTVKPKERPSATESDSKEGTGADLETRLYVKRTVAGQDKFMRVVSKVILIVTVLIPCVMSVIQISPLDEDFGPSQPYTFGYKVHDKDGDQWREEKSDGQGKVEGSYGYVDNLGMKREVYYIADDDGFRANIKTNEPGMDVPNPADVVMNANPPSDYDAAIYSKHLSNLNTANYNKPSSDYDAAIYSKPLSNHNAASYNNPSSDYEATIYGIEALPPDVRPIQRRPLNLDKEIKAKKVTLPPKTDPRGFYKYHRFAEHSVPPVYVVDGHLQSPWFPMDAPQRI